MEEDGEETPRTPFWVQSTTHVRRVDLYRRRASSLFFNSGVLIIFLLIFAILSMVFIVPSIISFTSQIFRPNLVKKSWDSINLVLVLFALAFGFLSRNINNVNNSDNNNDEKSRFGSDFSSPHKWYDFPDQPIGGLRRHRSSKSYSDLREFEWSPPPWRFSDDTHLKSHQSYFQRDIKLKDDAPASHSTVPVEEAYSPAPQPQDLYYPADLSTAGEIKKQSTYHKIGAEDGEKSRFLSKSDPPVTEFQDLERTQPLKSCSPEDLSTAGEEKKQRTYHNIDVEDGERSSLLPESDPPVEEFQDFERKGERSARKKGNGERRRARSSEPRKVATSSKGLAPEPPSPPSILPELLDSERKTVKMERKRTGANATKEFFSSFYQKKKKKRQRQRSLDNLDVLIHHSQPPVKFHLPPPSPPPPPPPPPPSVLNNLFTSKKEKRKKILQPTSSSPPPPPPPPQRAPKPTTTRVSPFITEKPKVPVKMSYLNIIDDSSSGGESPMSRIPPPPPMPPFRMPDWKFAVEGDYVRVQSTLSSGSGSPEGDEAQSPVASPAFCPSPDVDTKADNFIARFRAGLKLEKINSFNQNQGLRMSNLGPGSGPSHT